jgi:hypothetical protein
MLEWFTPARSATIGTVTHSSPRSATSSATAFLIAVRTAALRPPGFFVELLPTTPLHRCRHQLQRRFALFGGTTPFVATLVVDATGTSVAPATCHLPNYLAGIAVVGFLTALAVPETRFFLHGAEPQAADSANLTWQDQSTQDMHALPD